MIDFSLIEIFLIVFSQIVLLFLFYFFSKKNSKRDDVFRDKLELVESIFRHTKHDKILSLEDIRKIELDQNIKSVNVFSQDIYRDVKNNGQFANEKYNVGTFYETVAKNIKHKKSYNYFLKKDANFRHSVISFFGSHNDLTDVNFVIIPSNKYYFYNEVYLYEYIDSEEYEYKAKAYEFLPSISNEDEEMLYYLELDQKQVKRLLDIKENLLKKHYESSQEEIKLIKSKMNEFSTI